SPPLCVPQGHATSRANPLQVNTLHVSTFSSKILPAAASPAIAFKAKTVQSPQLSHILSRFYPQVLSIQRFCSCLPATLMIPKDQETRGIYLFGVMRSQEGGNG